jgi:hypothetical protein
MGRIFLIAALLSAQLPVLGQVVSTENKRGVTRTDAQIAADTIQVSDPITISTNQMNEATVAVLPPHANAACTNGRLFFGSGWAVQPIDLTGTDPPPKLINFAPLIDKTKDPVDPLITLDNHIVATKDGLLVYTIMGVTWKDDISPHPAWWSQTREYPLKNQKVEGGRGAIWVFKSKNCGDSWEQMPTIDAARLKVAGTVGYCAWPRIPKEKGAQSEAGGWDGHYLHADMFSGHLYITTPCTSGKGELGLVLMSDQNVKSWTVVHEVSGTSAYWRIPVTTLSNGSVIVAYLKGAKAFVARAAAPGGAFNEEEVATISFPSDLVTRAALKAFMYAYPTLARITDRASSGVKEGYQLATYFNADGDVAYQLQRRGATAPTQNAGTVSGAKKGNSVLQGTFVEATGQAALGNDSPSVFFWLEQVETGKFQVRFQPFIGGSAVADPANISQVFQTPTFTGDYVSGTSYRMATGLWKFYLSWSQSGSLKCVELTIRVPDRRPIQNIVIKRVRPSFKFQPISAELIQNAKPTAVHSKIGAAATKPTRQ